MNVESKRIKHSFIVGNKLHGATRNGGRGCLYFANVAI
jgi:hypothetical protein